MPDSLMFVQFPHPGSEHRPNGQLMDWTRGDHARKFLKATGRYLQAGNLHDGAVAFWGEWEPQSRIIDVNAAPIPGEPRWLHEPFWEVPSHRRLLKNTDPLVFGKHFLYSNCRQARNRKLRELAPGSIVLFGSKLAGSFVLDTVFVVDDRSYGYTRGSTDQLVAETWVREVVLEPMRRDTAHSPSEEFRLYEGRTQESLRGGPFSFVPSRPWEPGKSWFQRPVVDLGRRWIEPNLAMGAKASLMTAAEGRELWHAIVQQVTVRDGLSLGVEFDPPPHQEAPRGV